MPICGNIPSRWFAWLRARLGNWLLISACGVGGAAVGTAVSMPGKGWMALVGLVPFGCALLGFHKPTIAYSALFVGAAAYHAIALRWMGEVFFGMLEDVWFLSIVLGTFCWFVGFGLGRAAFLGGCWPMAVVLPAIWLVCEYLRHLVFGVIDGNGMPLVWLGQAAVDFLPLMQCADLAGVFAPTWLLASASGALLDLSAFGFRPSRGGIVRAAKSVAISGSFLLLAWGYGLWRMDYSSILEGPRIALLTGEIRDDWQLIARNATTVVPAHAAVSDASSNNVDLAAWPETAYAGVVLTRGRKGVLETDDVEHLLAVANSLGVPIVVGAPREEIESVVSERFNSAILADHQSKQVLTQDKRHLVALVECQTPLIRFLGSLLNVPSEWLKTRFSRGRGLTIFPVQLQGSARSCPVGVTVCYDLFFSKIHRELVFSSPKGEAAEAFLGILKDVPEPTGTLAHKSLTHTRLRAIEFRRPYYRVSEGGISAIVDSSGRVLESAKARPGARILLIGSAPLDGRGTVYAFCGDWLPITWLIIVVSVASLRCWSQRKRRSLTAALKRQ